MRVNPVPIFVKIIELDMTREEAAARASIGKDTLRKIEREQMVSLKSLRRLCLSLGIKLSEVLVSDAATPSQTQRPEVLGDSRGAQANQHGDNQAGARRESTGAILPYRQRNNG